MQIGLAKSLESGQFWIVSVVGFSLLRRRAKDRVSLLGGQFSQFGGCPTLPASFQFFAHPSLLFAALAESTDCSILLSQAVATQPRRVHPRFCARAFCVHCRRC